MFDNFLKDVILFNSLDIENRRKYLRTELDKYGLPCQKQVFQSCFGMGENIFTEIGNGVSLNTIVISAHYDGDSIFDNAGGVIALLYLAKKILDSNYPNRITTLFTDQEEKYQQGAGYFLMNYNSRIFKNLNIDGFGIGDNIYSTSPLLDNSKGRHLFFCDSDEFSKFNVSSSTYFSAFSDDYCNALSNKMIYATFFKYNSTEFFIRMFNLKNINDTMNKLWTMIP